MTQTNAAAGGSGSPDDDALLETYRSTRWVIEAAGGTLVFRMDGDLDLCARLGSRTVAIVTASNPASRPLDDAENDARNRRLADRLREAGLRYVPCVGVGADTTWREASFAVLDCDRAMATSLGAAFGQNAVVWVEAGEPPQLLITRKGFVGRALGDLV